MYDKLLIVISYYLDKFLLLSYPPSPIWRRVQLFSLLHSFFSFFHPCPWPTLRPAVSVCLCPLLAEDRIDIGLPPTSPYTHSDGNNSAVASQRVQHNNRNHHNLDCVFTSKAGFHTATPLVPTPVAVANSISSLAFIICLGKHTIFTEFELMCLLCCKQPYMSLWCACWLHSTWEG